MNAFVDATQAVREIHRVSMDYFLVSSINRAERVTSAYADAAYESWLAIAKGAYYGEGLPSTWSRHWKDVLPGGIHDKDEMISELQSIVGIEGRLSAEEATEAVRRALCRLHPFTKASWSRADCKAIAYSLLSQQDLLSEDECSSPRYKPEAFLDLKSLRGPHPPLWLEWGQLALYWLGRHFLQIVGFRSHWADGPNGLRLHWHDSCPSSLGGGDEVPLVLIHGMYTNALSMGLLGLLLRTNRRVVLVDLTNMDYTFSTLDDSEVTEPAIPRPVSLEVLCAHLSWFVETHLAPAGSGKQVDVCGHSFGANIALHLARTQPGGGVRLCHLLAPGGAGASSFSSITRTPDLEAIPRAVRPFVLPSLLGIFASPNTVNAIFEPSYIRYVRQEHAAKPLTACPCHLIFGSCDELVSPRPAQGLAKTFPNASCTFVVNARHQLNVLNPAAVASSVESFEMRHGHGGGIRTRRMNSLATSVLRIIFSIVDRISGVKVSTSVL